MTNMKSLFRDDQSHRLIVHSCHHKCGTHWLRRILGGVAKNCHLSFEAYQKGIPLPDEGILFDQQSRVDVNCLPAFRGSHMVRDPRDVVVSGYFYHLWTTEEWVHKPQDRFGGLSYQQYLKSVDMEHGLIAEIDTSRFVFRQMQKWDYENANIIELKYETCFANPVSSFEPVLQHYGFRDGVIEQAMDIVEQSTFEALTRRRPGVVQEGQVTRSGQPGKWKECFTDCVKAEFRKQANGLLQFLKYEISDNWQDT